ncbi:MAG: hypothetical protein AB7I13_00015 [Vicinamibacterales bacterium]
MAVFIGGTTRYTPGYLLRLIASERDNDEGEAPRFWPFDCCDWKPGDRIRELEKAGALIAAEIDRLLRVGQEKPE